MEANFDIVANRVDLLRGSIQPAKMVIRDGRIVEVQATNAAVDAYVIPGFVDAHVHIESSMLLPTEFARAAVVHGTVATVSDPHEIANVCGEVGIRFMLENAARSPFKFCFGAPSCVPATEFETAGAALHTDAITRLMEESQLAYLSEVMDFPGVIARTPSVMSKIAVARRLNRPIDGHAPGLVGAELRGYLSAGISTDHETATLEEGLEKIRLGCKIAIREGSAAKNFDALWPLIDQFPDDCMFCSDDKHPDDLLLGHINLLVARAVDQGCDVLNTLRVACLNPVLHYGLDVGLLREGDSADFLVLEDLHAFRPLRTYIGGRCVARGGKTQLHSEPAVRINQFGADPIAAVDLKIPSMSDRMRVIQVIDGQLVTLQQIVTPAVQGKSAVTDTDRDLLKLVVLNRYKPAPPSVAFVRGFHLKQGALASSVAHDSHNIIAVGVQDDEIVTAINAVIQHQGGLAVAQGKTVDVLPLPVAGLMSLEPAASVASSYASLDTKAKRLGCRLRAPFMTLSFLALPVIPSLKLTDRGLVDVLRFEVVPLFVV